MRGEHESRIGARLQCHRNCVPCVERSSNRRAAACVLDVHNKPHLNTRRRRVPHHSRRARPSNVLDADIDEARSQTLATSRHSGQTVGNALVIEAVLCHRVRSEALPVILAPHEHVVIRHAGLQVHLCAVRRALYPLHRNSVPSCHAASNPSRATVILSVDMEPNRHRVADLSPDRRRRARPANVLAAHVQVPARVSDVVCCSHGLQTVLEAARSVAIDCAARRHWLEALPSTLSGARALDVRPRDRIARLEVQIQCEHRRCVRHRCHRH